MTRDINFEPQHWAGVPSSTGSPSIQLPGPELALIVESVPPDAPRDDQVLIGRFTGQAWGGILATFRDPEGNEMQIFQERE